MSVITLTGLAANDPLPGHYFEVAFAQGEPSLGTTTYAAMLLANMLSTGSATSGTVIYGPNNGLQSENDAITLFGRGSEMHRMYKFWLKGNKNTPVYAVAIADPAGTAATKDMVVTVTATGNGNLRIFVCGEFVDTAITSGDTIGTVTTNAVTNINSAALTNGWPLTAAVVTTSTIRFTARQTGLRGNWIRIGNQITAGIGTAVSNGAFGFLASGATADSNTTALATILPYRYYYIVSAAGSDLGGDATQAGALLTQVGTQAAPTVGIRQRVFFGSNDSLANVTTLATGFNNARADVVHLKDGDWEPQCLNAFLAGVVATFEAPFPMRCNFAGFGNDALTSAYWSVPAPLNGAAPTRANLVSALNNGISPIGVNANKSTYLVNLVTTRSLSGSTPDYRIRDHHKVTICDRFTDDLQTKFTLNFAGKLIGDDPPAGGRTPGPNVITPKVVRFSVEKLVREYAEADLLQQVDTIIAGTIVQRDTSPTTRISSSIPLRPVDAFFQSATFVAQVA